MVIRYGSSVALPAAGNIWPGPQAPLLCGMGKSLTASSVDPRLDLLRKVGPAAGNIQDGLHDGLGRLKLGQIAPGFDLQGLVDVAVLRGRAEEDNPGLRSQTPDPACGLEAAHARHRDVHEDDVGVELNRLGDCLVRRARLGDHSEARLQLQAFGQCLSHQGMVIYDEDPYTTYHLGFSISEPVVFIIPCEASRFQQESRPALVPASLLQHANPAPGATWTYRSRSERAAGMTSRQLIGTRLTGAGLDASSALLDSCMAQASRT